MYKDHMLTAEPLTHQGNNNFTRKGLRRQLNIFTKSKMKINNIETLALKFCDEFIIYYFTTFPHSRDKACMLKSLCIQCGVAGYFTPKPAIALGTIEVFQVEL